MHDQQQLTCLWPCARVQLVEQKVIQEGKEVQDKKKEEQEQWTRLQEERAAVAKERASLEATENELKILDGQIQARLRAPLPCACRWKRLVLTRYDAP
jgi:hypothetical protein